MPAAGNQGQHQSEERAQRNGFDRPFLFAGRHGFG
jgi:hypothetical protein